MAEPAGLQACDQALCWFIKVSDLDHVEKKKHDIQPAGEDYGQVKFWYIILY